MSEIALTEIDQWASNLGLCIAGYYTAHENLKEASFEKASNRIADKIAENFNSACLVVVDNRKLSLHLDNLALRVAQYSDGKYRQMDSQKVNVEPPCVLEACASLLQRQAYKQLIDFDNHLDDISLDWSNQQINDDVTDMLKLCGSLC
ncbi:ER membrane protein complex subunit 8/9 [Carabus blaptoides fortunei]